MADIFISYRRDGGDMTAMYISQALRERGYDVFYDVEVLNNGKFNEALLQQIHSCKDFLVVLSPHALDRCSNPDDWVRLEIAEAIKTEKNIVPIMMTGFSFPSALPEDINSLRYHNGLTSTTEYFHESINRLCDRFLLSKPRKKRALTTALIGLTVACVVAAALFLFFRFGAANPSASMGSEVKGGDSSMLLSNESLDAQKEQGANGVIQESETDEPGQDMDSTEQAGSDGESELTEKTAEDTDLKRKTTPAESLNSTTDPQK